MTSIIWCKCGAEYKRTDTKFLVTHKGEAFCDECGAMLESWDSTHVPSFEHIETGRAAFIKGNAAPPRGVVGVRPQCGLLFLFA